ncbi:hypothetical protein YG5714_1456 [Sulfolobus islandicus Y.G.57.14]|uniref:Uncharacterized protein n=1 Tax=Saccharolobus islandicus (strain Y.G.57.14 / Yellowstone \|nr:hypothetical protein YG5714_1456 [Sulfolobus islandicus Y.G.57.14]
MMKTFNLLLTYFLTQLYPVAPEQFRILLILLFSDDLFYLKDFLFKSIEPLINNIDLFSRR